MVCQQDSFKPALKVNSITFCSCVAHGTELEQISTKREVVMMWAKDAAAGFGLVMFMMASFLAAHGAQGIVHLL
jgi:hypothetical protein